MNESVNQPSISYQTPAENLERMTTESEFMPLPTLRMFEHSHPAWFFSPLLLRSNSTLPEASIFNSS